MLDVAAYLEALSRHGETMAAAVQRAGPEAAVPTCPGWSVRDLVRHTGEVHRWATGIVADERTEAWNASADEIVGEWPDDAGLVSWFCDGVASLAEVIAQAPDDLVCWTFMQAPDPKTFWARRQTHEIAIHCADAELAIGETPVIAPEIGADGIDELLVASLTRRGRGPRHEQAHTLAVETTDTGDRWVSTIGPDGFATVRGDGAAQCEVRGRAGVLHQFLWNRLDRSVVEVSGDEVVLDVWRAGARI